MLENSPKSTPLSPENITIFFVAALLVVVAYWYLHSLQRLNHFNIDEPSLWNLNLPAQKNIADGSHAAIAEYLKQEETLQKTLYQKRNATNVDWLEVARLNSELGALQLNAGQFQKAEVSYSEALSVFNNHETKAPPLEIAQNWQGLGQSALANGETLKALSLSEHAVQLLQNDHHPSENISDLALVTAAEANFKMNKLDAASAKYKELIERNEKNEHGKVPTNVFTCAQAFARCGDIARSRKDYSSSRQDYQQANANFAIALAHRDSDLRSYTARCLYSQALVDEGESNWLKATQELEEAIKINGDSKSPFVVLLKKAYARTLSHSNFLKGQFATVDALNALDELEAKKI
jgi:tetratricopeptide (TPR) repeat protein